MSKKIVITGALGHIGSRLIHSLRPGEYDQVLLLDNLFTQRYCSLYHLPAKVPFQFVEADICKDELEKHLTGAEAVIHLAAITNAEGSFDIQEQVERVNFEGTERVARACLATGAKMIFLSTTSVYGTQEAVVAENCPPEALKPQSPYAASKLRAEQLLQSMGESDGLHFFIARFGTIYGISIGMRFHTAVNKFCWQASVGQPITVWRTAIHQKRPYLDLRDAIRVLRFVLATDRFDNQVYNVLNENITVKEIVDMIQTQVPDVQIQYVDSRIMNQLSYTVDNAQFQRLGFHYEGGIAQGVADTLDLLRGLYQGRLNG
jgi:UDP-glucose 4-epimerase